MKNIYWVGNRASDIEYIKNEFAGYVCLYGENNNKNKFSNVPVRKNNSVIDDSSNTFFATSIDKIVIEDPNAYFIFYNPLVAHKIISNHKNRFLCLNEYELIRIFDDKIQCHSILNKIADFCPFVTLFGSDISYKKLKTIFPNEHKFAIQESKSAAGLGTFIIDKKNFDTIKKKYLKDSQIYLVSVFQKEANTFNIHTVIDKRNTLIFPPSYSIMECNDGQMHYRGSSYINATTEIGEKNIKNAHDMINRIVKLLKRFNYKGIIGFDFLYSKTKIYLLELNLRFQGSSNVLNKMLIDSKLPSLVTLNLLAFEDKLYTLDMNSINSYYANIFYYFEDEDSDLLPFILCDEFDDNVAMYTKFENGSYIKRKIYKY